MAQKGIDQLIINSPCEEPKPDLTKWEYLAEWVKAVNEHGGFGKWRWVVSKNPADLVGVLASQ